MRRLLLLLMAVTLVGMTGCVTYNEDLTLQKDGSGIMKMHLAMNRQMVDQMQAMAAQFGDEGDEKGPLEEMQEDFDRDKIEASLKEAKTSVKLEAYDHQVTDDAYVWDMSFSFKDFADLNALDQTLGDAGESGQGASQSSPGQAQYVKQPDGTWIYTRSLEDTDEDADMMGGAGASGDEEMADDDTAGEYDAADDTGMADESESMDDESGEEAEAAPDSEDMEEQMEEFGKAMEQMGAMMQSMTAGADQMGFTFTVHFPGKILESNATRTEGNTAIWEFDMSQLQGGGATGGMMARIKP